MTTQATATSPQLSADTACPCGSGKTFALCCEPLLTGKKPASTAEALMRSRYTAHVTKNYRYLHATFLGTAGQPYVEEPADDGDMTWSRLVVNAHDVGAKPDQAFVDFSAYFKADGVEQVIQEKSEFQNIDGKWFYTRPVRQGPAPVKSSTPKVGRNDPCPCGSGKKYKQCCL